MSKDTWSKFSYKVSGASPPLQATKVQLERTNNAKSFSSATSILDIACGPGTVFHQLFALEYSFPENATLIALDISPQMIDQIKSKQADDPQWQRINAAVCDATDLSTIRDDSQSHVLSAMGIFVIPDSTTALKEARRVLAPDGIFSMTTVAQASWVTDIFGQLTKVCSDRKVPFAAEKWQTREAFKAELESAGFSDVEVFEAPLEMPYESPEKVVESLWVMLPFVSSLTSGMSEGEISRVKELMAKRVREGYPDGHLPGLSLAGVGRK